MLRKDDGISDRGKFYRIYGDNLYFIASPERQGVSCTLNDPNLDWTWTILDSKRLAAL